MAEILNLETLQAQKAKSDALGSLSHELRSPLHGVMLSTELLNDTDLTVFQGNATHTIETCCRTLLDTIDHLLDYSKVNNFAAERKHKAGSRSPKLRKQTRTDQFGKKKLYSDARLDGLVEEVVESVFAGFNFQHMSVRQLSKQGKPKHTDITAHNQLDSAQAMEQLGPSLDGAGEQGLHFGDVSVCISIDPSCNWMFHMQSGAIRRIVMNLLGNSLKYTARGSIRILLSQEASTAKRPEMDRIVKLIVQDTGKGMGEDYLRHKLFKPFSQEDELSPGTGLGLSLVKQITSQLRGQIFVESRVGVGTTIAVTLPLEQSPSPCGVLRNMPEDAREFEEQVRKLKGLRVRLSGFEQQGCRDERAIVEDICSRWLHLDLVLDQQAQQTAPDIVLWSEDALPESFGRIAQLAKTPNVVVCQDALVAYKRFSMYEDAGQGGIFDFISQPIGPRKFAKSILLAYMRWMGLPKLLRPPRPRLTRSRSSYSGELPTNAFTVEKGRMPGLTANLESSRAWSASAPVKVVPPHLIEWAEPQAQADQETASECEKHIHADKMLLVDDNHINLKLMSAYMGKLGRTYEAVTNGKEALDAYTQNLGHFAGIIMDISMPIMDGFEATRRIRAFERRNQLHPVAILALTGLASDSAHQEALESGVDVFLTKPIKLKDLRQVLESMHMLPLPSKAAPRR